MKPCRPPNSPLASAKPSCNSARRVRKRSNNCDCYSEKQVDSASGRAFALPGYGGLRRCGRTSVQDSLRLKKTIFSCRKFGRYQHSLAALEHASISSPSLRSPHGSANGYASMETYLLFALYLLRSIGSLEQFETRPRSSYERACQERGRSFRFCFLLSHVCVPS